MKIASCKSIAVLPFVNRSSNEELEYFSDGMTEEIINALSKIQGLSVCSRTSSFQFKNSTIGIAEIAKTLAVSILLQGSVRLSGNQIRITIQLIEAHEDVHFWSENYDREFHNIFAVQDEISLLIADKLREHLGHFELADSLVDNYPISFAAYQKYLRARYHLMKLNTKDSFIAIRIFEGLMEECPQFPFSYLDAHQAYTYMGTMGLMPAVEAFEKAAPLLEKAIAHGPELAETQLNLSWVSCWQYWDLAKAYQHIHQAMSIRSADHMYLSMSNFLTLEKKFDTAMHYVDKALELAPLSAMNMHYKGFLYYLQKDFDQAIAYNKRSLQLQEDLPFPSLTIGNSYSLQGKTDQALDYFDSLSEETSGFFNRMGGKALAYACAGNIEKVAVYINKFEKLLEGETAAAAISFLIQIYAQLGEEEKAMLYYQQAVAYRLPIVLLIATEPMAAPLHKLEAFQNMQASLLKKTDSEPIRKYRKSLFTAADLEKHKKALRYLMEAEEAYLNPDLSLRALAEDMSLSANQLSQLLNEGFEQNFADFVNSYRLQKFIEKLKAPDAHQLTLLALAYDSGFNSKTVFNNFFKKKMKTTPSKYFKDLAS
jgi:TolB-like protein/AraC-like DNA-binding protein